MSLGLKPPPDSWRYACLAGLATGLALAPLVGQWAAAQTAWLCCVAGCGGLAAWVAHERRSGHGRPAGVSWTYALALSAGTLALGAGAAAGSVRTAAIDGGALRADPGRPVSLAGTVESFPRREPGGISFELSSPAGRVQVRAPHGTEAAMGSRLQTEGVLREPEPWRADALERRGIAMLLEAQRTEAPGGGRGGFPGGIDAIRSRAERGLERGMPQSEAALARGFVLGQDDGIDEVTREDFRRSGLAHLLAVSGQNVALLCVLAWPLLALLGLTLRARLFALLALIALYVPLTGAGPSIQRAGVMGAAGLVAALADRPSSRAYALLLAAAVTLAVNPYAAGDVGWQLSFSAVVGILLWTSRLAGLLGAGSPRSSPRRALADGAAMTAAATVATAPLMAHHFESLSVAALPANLLALPAVAPAMWLGMLTSFAAQVPAIPVEPLNWVASLCLAYIAQVARWFGAPGWAQLDVSLDGPLAVAGAYFVLIGAVEAGLAVLRRRGGLHTRFRPAGPRRSPRPAIAAAVLACALTLAGPVSAALRGERQGTGEEPSLLTVRVLDVGQGDAILLDPPGGLPMLVDTGPPGGGVGERLRDLGVSSLSVVLVTHSDSDHAGGLDDVMSAAAPARLALAAHDPALLRVAAAAGAEPVQIVEGAELRSGDLRLSALWPPRELVSGLGAKSDGEEQNRLSVVLLAEWRHFSMLLTGDAEAEAVPLAPGPVDVLKVAHHGSDDAGLSGLLDGTAPRLAVISVGENPFGHPASATLSELESRPFTVLRTDEHGEVLIQADPAGWRVAG
jgi:competence protein ComEC